MGSIYKALTRANNLKPVADVVGDYLYQKNYKDALNTLAGMYNSSRNKIENTYNDPRALRNGQPPPPQNTGQAPNVEAPTAPTVGPAQQTPTVVGTRQQNPNLVNASQSPTPPPGTENSAIQRLLGKQAGNTPPTPPTREEIRTQPTNQAVAQLMPQNVQQTQQPPVQQTPVQQPPVQQTGQTPVQQNGQQPIPPPPAGGDMLWNDYLDATGQPRTNPNQQGAQVLDQLTSGNDPRQTRRGLNAIYDFQEDFLRAGVTDPALLQLGQQYGNTLQSRFDSYQQAPPEYFNLSEGEARFGIDPNTGQMKKVAEYQKQRAPKDRTLANMKPNSKTGTYWGQDKVTGRFVDSGIKIVDESGRTSVYVNNAGEREVKGFDTSAITNEQREVQTLLDQVNADIASGKFTGQALDDLHVAKTKYQAKINGLIDAKQDKIGSSPDFLEYPVMASEVNDSAEKWIKKNYLNYKTDTEMLNALHKHLYEKIRKEIAPGNEKEMPRVREELKKHVSDQYTNADLMRQRFGIPERRRK